MGAVRGEISTLRFARQRVWRLSAAAMAVSIVLVATPAQSQPAPAPERSAGWDKATTIMAVTALGLQVFTPRTFFADPEVTAGWKARWHVSVLAPVMTLATVAYFNENTLKSSFEGTRPDCNESNAGTSPCGTYGMLSTETFVAFSALGHGAGVFLGDTLKWSHGQFHGGALAVEVGVPAVLATLTAVGRSSGNWETGGQVLGSAGIGLGVGLGMGLLYSITQRPECGYTGSLICWSGPQAIWCLTRLRED